MIAAGMIAAGHGTRLQERFPGTIKPMVPLAGSPLIGWPVRSLEKAGVRDLTVLFNGSGAPAARYLEEAFPGLRVSVDFKDTDSSFESFVHVCKRLSERSERFLVTTVDALVSPTELERFLDVARDPRADGALGVTDFIDDEKPLWVDCDERGWITALGENAETRTLATSGLYALTKGLAQGFPEPDGRPLRSHLTRLVREGKRLRAVSLSKSVDVDRPEDLTEAERFVKEHL